MCRYSKTFRNWRQHVSPTGATKLPRHRPLSHPRCAFCRSDPFEIYRRFSRGEPLSRVAVVQGRSEPQTRKKCWSLFVPHKRNHRPDPLACSWNQARRMMGSRRSGRHPATMTTAVSVTSSAALLTRRLNLRKTRVGCRRTPVSSQAPASYHNDFPPSLSLSRKVFFSKKTASLMTRSLHCSRE